MSKTLSNLIFILVISTVLVNCANRGTPQGGEKDKLAPIILKSVPENYSTNFKGSEIKIYFNEYVKLKNLQKQLIISPPMKTQPEILPLGSASKYITIKIFDTLQANTTYAFNFGESVVDNNEENPYSYYRYVFSTGDYIDSLSVKGNIFDAEKRKTEEFVSVMLYEIDSTYNDSIVYKENPKYITNTLDSTTTFAIENLKAGTYKLIALKDENANNTFQQKTDKIGFHEGFITVPSDSVYDITLFKEAPDFKATRASLVAGQKIAFGFEGDPKNMDISLISDAPNDYNYRVTRDKKKDTLYYWYKPKFETDSVYFKVTNNTYNYTKDSLVVKVKEAINDSLLFNVNATGVIGFNQSFKLTGNIPFTNIDNSKIKLIDKDSTAVVFKVALDSLNNTYVFDFEKGEEQDYKIQLFPGALSDFFEGTNDTLNYNFRTKKESDYGNVRVSLINVSYPVIVQIVDDKGEVKAEQFAAEPRPFDFKYLNPAIYYVRVVVDANGNQKWDSGSFLKQRQAERISYFPDPLEVRAGWDLIQEFILE